MAYLTPTRLDAALDALAGGARALAGGTDFYPALGEGPVGGDLVDLTGLAELSGIGPGPEGWRIGATATWAEIAAAGLAPGFDALVQAARRVGGVQVQNAGTIGGNLVNASPAADGVVALLALGARVELASRAGRRFLALADFLIGPGRVALGPGELLAAVHLPAPTGRSVFRKLGSRAHLVISCVMASLWVERAGARVGRARVAVGACSPVARRLGALEAALAGRRLAELADPALVRPEYLAPLSPIDDIRADAAYRLEAARRLVSDLLGQLGGGHG